ncbi:MAG: sulfatase [Candidatus Binatia bacterium]
MLARALLIAAAIAALAYTLFRIVATAASPLAEPAACVGCNVLLISIDTLRADHLGVYGHDRPTSPAIDALASRSVVFEDAIGQSAWTRPAHASMLTALYPSEHGIVGMDGHRGLAAELLTLPAVLAARGYATAAFTGGANMSAHFGFDNGFETYRSPGRRIEDAIAGVDTFLAGRREPFFLFVHGFDAHKPYRATPVDREALGLRGERARGLARACREGQGPDDLAAFMADYDAAIHRADRGVAKLLELLERHGVADRTVIVLTADHGEEFLEHGRCSHIRALYREVVRVPLIVHVPGVAAGRVAGVVPASVAIAPTVLEIVTDGNGASELSGPSLAPALLGGPRPGTYVISETSSRVTAENGGGYVISLSADDEKLLWWIENDEREYFDLASDPYERRPLAREPRIGRLGRQIERWRREHPPRVRHAGAGVLPRKLERELRALGYAN